MCMAICRSNPTLRDAEMFADGNGDGIQDESEWIRYPPSYLILENTKTQSAALCPAHGRGYPDQQAWLCLCTWQVHYVTTTDVLAWLILAIKRLRLSVPSPGPPSGPSRRNEVFEKTSLKGGKNVKISHPEYPRQLGGSFFHWKLIRWPFICKILISFTSLGQPPWEGSTVGNWPKTSYF